MDFRAVIKDKDGIEQWEIPFNSFSFTEEINNDRNCSLSLNNQSIRTIADKYGVSLLHILSARYRELEIYDGATKRYAGYISNLNFGRGSGEEGSTTIASKGFFSLLDKRYSESSKFFAAEDSADIAWYMINYTQTLTPGGDLGITRGSHPATKDRQRTFTYSKISDEIIGMSNREVTEGYDFEIDNDKVFTIYYPAKDQYKPEVILEDGYNITSYGISMPFIDSMCNEVIVNGNGFGEDASIEIVDSIDDYKNAFFLLQDTLNEKDVIDTDTLIEKGERYIAKKQSPQITLDLNVDYNVVDYDSIVLGDWVNVKISYWGIDALYRVIGRTLDDRGNIKLKVDSTL